MAEKEKPPLRKFEDTELQAAFSLPEKPTGRQILAYDSLWELRVSALMYERLWIAARELIVDWECPHVGLDADLGQDLPMEAVRVIKWAALTVLGFREELESLPKN